MNRRLHFLTDLIIDHRIRYVEDVIVFKLFETGFKNMLRGSLLISQLPKIVIISTIKCLRYD